jgi:hypothetical protein
VSFWIAASLAHEMKLTICSYVDRVKVRDSDSLLRVGNS